LSASVVRALGLGRLVQIRQRLACFLLWRDQPFRFRRVLVLIMAWCVAGVRLPLTALSPLLARATHPAAPSLTTTLVPPVILFSDVAAPLHPGLLEKRLLIAARTAASVCAMGRYGTMQASHAPAYDAGTMNLVPARARPLCHRGAGQLSSPRVEGNLQDILLAATGVQS
jgi:hypothetical protein